MKIQFKTLSALIVAGLVLSGATAPAGAAGPAASYYVDCNETSASKSRAVDRGQMLPANTVGAFVCEWQGPTRPYLPANALKVENSKALIAALKQSKRDDTAACIDDKVADQRFGFTFGLPNNKQVFIRQVCGGFTSSYSQGVYVLTPAATTLVNAEIQKIQTFVSGIEVTSSTKVKQPDCPMQLGASSGTQNRPHLLPQGVVAATFCGYERQSKKEVFTDLAIRKPHSFALMLNSDAKTAKQLHTDGILCTADMWSRDYMIVFAMLDGSTVTVDLTCHTAATSTYTSQRFQLGAKASAQIQQLMRQMR